MLSRAINRKQRGRRPLTGLAVVSLVAGLLVVSGVALATHEQTFQLDGDASATTVTHIPTGTTQTVDWDSLFNADGSTKSPLPANYSDATLTPDFNHTGSTFLTNDSTTFATGSKDTLPISGWQCNLDNNVNSKIDVMNAYSTSYQVGTAGDEFIYFGLERNTNTGTADVGFWFLQDAVGCTSTGPAVTFGGVHLDGDILVVSEFSNGGTVSTINVYRWDRNNGSADCGLDPVGPACVTNQAGVPGFLNPIAVGGGVDCRNGTTAAGDPACAASNTTANGTGGTITTPWLTANAKDKVAHSLRTSEFFEGGVNLTDLHLGGKCFNTFIGDTRSSTSLTATLFDFALGVTGSCTSTTVTAPKYDNGTSFVDVPAAGVSIGANARVNVRDSALLTVDGVDSYAGNVTFSLCGPLDLTSTTNCQTGGVQIGSPVNVAGTSPETVLGPIATLTSAGRYCWRADYSGDTTAGVPPSSDPSDATSVSECFKVNPVQPLLSTQATTGPVDFGQVISDKVFLTGTAKQPGTDGVGPGGTINATAGTQAAAAGTISVTAYGPGNCTTTALATVSLTVSGDKADPLFYGGPGSATEFQPASPGQYTFVASYGGNDPNTSNVAATACGTQPSNERVTVRTIPTEIATTPSYFPQDSATITSSVLGNNLAANGTVTFSLYGATAGPVTALANCQAGGTTGRVYGPEAVLTGAAAHSATVGTNNTATRISGNGTYYWLVTYATPSGDSAHTGSQSNCVENINATLTGDAGPGSIFPTPAP